MEPVTYLLTFSSSVIFLAYFQAYRLDFSYDVMRKRLHQKRRVKYFKKNGFDVGHYDKLCNTVRDLQSELLALGVSSSDIPQYPLTFMPLSNELPPPKAY